MGKQIKSSRRHRPADGYILWSAGGIWQWYSLGTAESTRSVTAPNCWTLFLLHHQKYNLLGTYLHCLYMVESSTTTLHEYVPADYPRNSTSSPIRTRGRARGTRGRRRIRGWIDGWGAHTNHKLVPCAALDTAAIFWASPGCRIKLNLTITN